MNRSLSKNSNFLSKLRRLMSTTHLERTKDVGRNSLVMADATVKEIYNISPTIKFLNIDINKSTSVSFKSGQWVDFHILDIHAVGGYSMCSTPNLLQEKNELHLAVKQSDHKPAHWIHNECKVGAKVQLKVGGDIFFDIHNNNESKKNVLLIAGGIGINPLFSIFQNNFEVLQKASNSNNKNIFDKTSLLYSATTEDELVFKDRIDEIVSRDQHFSASYFVTRMKEQCKAKDTRINLGRLKQCDVQKAIDSMTSLDDVVAYLCGPTPMMEETKRILLKVGLHDENIKFESWW